MIGGPVKFTIDGRPVPWQRAGDNGGADGRGGRKFTPHAVRAAQKIVRQLALVAMGGRPLLVGPLRLTIECVYPIAAGWPAAVRDAALAGAVYHTGTPDFDNLQKLIADALNGVAWHDDAQIAEALFRKRHGAIPRTDVWVQPIGDNAPRTPGQLRLEAEASAYPHGKPKPPKGRARATSKLAKATT